MNKQPGMGAKFALVAGKDLVVRVFANTGKGGAVVNATASVCLDGKVDSCAADKLFTATGQVFELDHAFSVADRRAALNSLNIFITGDTAKKILTAGDHSFDCVVKIDKNSVPCAIDTTFKDSVQLNLFVAPVTLATIGPEKALLAAAGDMLKNVYPIRDDNVKVKTVNDKGFELKAAKFSDLAAIRGIFLDRLLKNDEAVKTLYGQVKPEKNMILVVAGSKANDNKPFGTDPTDGVSLLGFTIPGQQAPKASASSDRLPTGDKTIARGGKMSLPSTAAHEVGHLFGFGDEYTNGSNNINNPPHGKDQDATGTAAGYYILEAEQGFDVNGLRPKLQALDSGAAPPATPQPGAVFVFVDTTVNPPAPDKDPLAEGPIYGYMGGTGRAGVAAGLGAALEGGETLRAWTRELNYEFLYPLLTTAPPPPAPKGPRQVMHLSGMVSQNETVTFNVPLVATSDVEITAPDSGPYSIQFLDGSGNILSSVSFDIPFIIENVLDGVQTLDPAPFDIVAELPPGAVSAQFLLDGTILGTITAGQSAPSVSISSATITGDLLNVSWIASDPNGSPMVYIVTYLPNGIDRFVFATDITDLSTQASLTDFELPLPQPGAAVCVLATDGFQSTEVCNPIQ